MERQPIHAIWLDDNRPMPDGMYDIHARNFSEFRSVLKEISAHGETIDYVSFDYYLDDAPDPNWPAPYQKNGKHCAELLMMYEGILCPEFAYGSHSSSSLCAREITQFLDTMLERKVAC